MSKFALSQVATEIVSKKEESQVVSQGDVKDESKTGTNLKSSKYSLEATQKQLPAQDSQLQASQVNKETQQKEFLAPTQMVDVEQEQIQVNKEVDVLEEFKVITKQKTDRVQLGLAPKQLFVKLNQLQAYQANNETQQEQVESLKITSLAPKQQIIEKKMKLGLAPKQFIQQNSINQEADYALKDQTVAKEGDQKSGQKLGQAPKQSLEEQAAAKSVAEVTTSQKQVDNYIQIYEPFRRYKELNKCSQNQQKINLQQNTNQLQSMQLVLGIAQKMGFGDVLQNVFEIENKRYDDSTLQYVIKQYNESIQLKFYCEQSISENFEYKNSKAGDRPEIAQLTIRGDISNLQTSIQQDINNLLNKYANSGEDTLVTQLINLIKKQSALELQWDILEMILFEIYEKACIEDKFVEFYGRLICLFMDKLQKEQSLSKFMASISLYTGFKSLSGYFAQLIIKGRILPEIEQYRLLDSKFQNGDSSLIIELHMKLSLKFLGYIYVLSRGIYIPDLTFAQFLNKIFRILYKKMMQQFGSSVEQQTVISSDNQYVQLENLAKKVTKEWVSNCNYIDMILEALKIAIKPMQYYYQQVGCPDGFKLQFDLMIQQIQLIYDMHLFTSVQQFHIRDKQLLNKNVPINFDQQLAKQLTKTEIKVTNLTLADLDEWKQEKVFDILLLKFFTIEKLDLTLDLFDNKHIQSQFKSNMLELIKKQKLQQDQLELFLFQLSKFIQKIKLQDFFNDIVKCIYDDFYIWNIESYSKLISNLVTELLLKKQITFQFCLDVVKKHNQIIFDVLDAIIQQSFLDTLLEYEENQQLEEEDIAYIHSLIEKKQYADINNYAPYITCLQDDNFSYFSQSNSNLSSKLLNKFEFDIINMLKSIIFQKIDQSSEIYSTITTNLLSLIEDQQQSSKKIEKLFSDLNVPFATQAIEKFSFKTYVQVDKFIQICFQKSILEFLTEEKLDYFNSVVTQILTYSSPLPSKFFTDSILTLGCKQNNPQRASKLLEILSNNKLITKEQIAENTAHMEKYTKYDLSWVSK